MRCLILTLVVLLSLRDLTAKCADSLSVERVHGVIKLDLLGHGYYGYSYKQNQAGTLSAEVVCFGKRGVFGAYGSIGGGGIISNPIGFVNFSSGILLGKRKSFCILGTALALGITQHEVKVRLATNASETVQIKWGAELIPIIGYRFISTAKHFTFSLYAAPHFTLKTFEVNGTIERGTFWWPVGISIGHVL
jgi:hypothetical protein